MKLGTSRQRRRFGEFARKVTFTLSPLLLLLGGAELLARRLVEPPPDPTLTSGLAMVPHATRVWSLAPGDIKTGGLTHHISDDRLRVVAETGAELRVLTLGDSSIFGHGVVDADTLHANLAASLGERGVSADVLCGGVPGYSTAQSLLLLDEVGWDLEPDLLVIGNLWSDNNYGYFVDSEWLAELHSPVRRLDRALSWSVAWDWFRGFQRPAIARDGQLPISWVREPYPTEEGRRRVPLEDYAANLDEMLVQAAEREVGVVMLAPANRHRLSPDGSVVMWGVYFEAMRLVAENRGVLVVDALDALKPSGLSVDEAFLDEMHPTGPTNALYAGLLSEALVDEGWPEARLTPDGDAAPLAVTWRDPVARSDGPVH